MTIPTIELRNVSVNHSMSEETYCYSASLWVDGERWGDVCNRGQGGGDDFREAKGSKRTYKDLNDLDALLKAEGPKHDCGDGVLLDDCLEIRCGDLVTAHIRADEVKRALRSKLLYTHPDKAGLFQIPLKRNGRVHTVDAILASLDRQGFKYATVLNRLPFSEAYDLYFKVAA